MARRFALKGMARFRLCPRARYSPCPDSNCRSGFEVFVSSDAMPRKKTETPSLNTYPIWAPRIWHGMRLGSWLRLAARHRFRIHLLRIPMAMIVTAITIFNSAMYAIQRLFYGRAIAETEIVEPPFFIVGH